jgi:O-antigen ligase
MFAMAITLVISSLVGLGLIPVMSWMSPGTVASDPAIFQGHDTQNNLMTFAIFLALLEWRDATDRGKRIAWAIFALLATLNILFMVQGRTGYLTLILLLGWFGWSTAARELKKRGKSVGWKQGTFILVAMLFLAMISFFSSARLHDRVEKAITEFHEWGPSDGKATPENSSIGVRLDFYTNTLKIVQHNLLIGVGTGGFPEAYKQQVQSKDVVLTKNPHDEYLMISAQTGVIGLILLLYLFYTLWRYAPLLPTPFEQDAAKGLVLAYLVNCLLNSALMDHTDGLFFAFMSAVLYANLKIGKKA